MFIDSRLNSQAFGFVMSTPCASVFIKHDLDHATDRDQERRSKVQKPIRRSLHRREEDKREEQEYIRDEDKH